MKLENKTIFDTQIITDEEACLFIESAIENGSDASEAYQDMKMIDAFFQTERLHLLLGKTVQRTRAGHLRKGHFLHDSLNSVIEARINGEFKYEKLN